MKAVYALFICLIPTFFSLTFKIVDEDYILMPFGGEKRAIKLLIDPVGSFTYILRPYMSTTKIKHQETFGFSNNFGHFNGHWETDFIYPTSDTNFGFQLKYLQIDEAGTTLDADGVIGLGYSDDFPEGTNIYKILSKMTAIFDFKKVMTYDKKKALLTLGSVPPYDSFNPLAFDILKNDNPKIPINFVNLTQIGFFNKEGKLDLINIGEKAKFGLMPILTCPKSSVGKLNTLLTYMTTDDKDKIEHQTNKQNLYEDIFFSNPRTDIQPKAVMAFDKSAYKFAHTWKDKDGKTSSAVRLAAQPYGGYWYIGIDKLNINRADFDYDKMQVTLYSPTAYELGKTKTAYILFALLITISFVVIATIMIRYCCPKKKQQNIKAGEELIDL